MSKTATFIGNPGVRIIAKDVTVSNDTRLTGLNNNDMVIAPSGAGKSGSYIWANLVNPTSSMVVSDTKGRLLGMCEKHLKKLGYTIHKIDLVNPESSGGYNPLQYIRRTKDGRISEKDIKTLANTLSPVINSRDPFWEQAAARHITMLIAYVLEALPPEEQNMLSVCELHRSYLSGEGKAMIADWCEENPDTLAAKKYKEMSGFTNVDKTWGCTVEFVNNALDMFEYAEFAPIFEKVKSFDFRDLGRKKSALFLITSDNDSAYDRITNLINTQLLQTLIDEADSHDDGRLPVPCRIFLDDFAAGARIPEFSRIMAIIRSREISVSIILQSMTQLDSMYGEHDSVSITNNCDHILLFGPSSDLGTAKFVSTHLDKTQKSILTMSSEDAILIERGSKARIVKKIPPYSISVDDTEVSPEDKEAAYGKN